MANTLTVKRQDSAQDEIEILKRRNGTRTSTIGQDIIIGNSSATYGLGLDFWGEYANIDTIQIRDRIETYFINLFEWEGMDEDFRIEFESILFRQGKVAVVKLPDGEIYPTQFTFEEKDLDFYRNPKKIKMVTTNEFNGTELDKENFVIVYNNSTKHGTLTFALERLRQVTRSLIDIDNASLLSRPKWGVGVSADDNALTDMEIAYHSNKAFVPTGNITLESAGAIDMAGSDQTASKIDTYNFQVANMLKMLGLQADTANKAERMSELEVARNDEFDNLLIKDMHARREAKVEELNTLGLNVSLNELKEEQEDKQEPNGEMNKKVLKELDGGNNDL